MTINVESTATLKSGLAYWGRGRNTTAIIGSELKTLERRLHTRHRARTTVYITVPGSGRRLCRAVNLSATGVFIQTTNLGLRKGQNVELVFAINLGAITKLHRRTAVVAHVSRGGTGLMMESYSSAAAPTARVG